MLKKIIVGIFLIINILLVCFPVCAASPDSYTRVDVPGDTTELRLSRDTHIAYQDLTSETFGFKEAFDGITDIYCGNSRSIYLLCGEKSRLIKISSDYKSAQEVSVTDTAGEKIDFSGASGVFSDNSDNIYIADTLNARILILNSDGVLISTLGAPVSDLIPKDFLYQPIAIKKDTLGYTYILSLGSYYGAALYSPEYEFMGFYGANTVQSSALDTLSFLWNKFTGNETKKASSMKKLPYSFSDFNFDPQGNMVTCTGDTQNSIYAKSTGQIKKISSNGANVLYKRDLKGNANSSSTVNFLESEQSGLTAAQDLVSIEVSDDNFIFALDKSYGIVYAYDSKCNMISAFGGGYGGGNQLGTFRKPVAIALNGDSVLVADGEKRSVTVFKTTEYGKLLKKAQTMYIHGDYEEAKSLWEDVLTQNRNCQLAYRGLAMAYYREGDYNAALKASKTAVDYFVYDLAWKEIVSGYIGEHFVVIISVIAVVVIATVFLIIYLKKKKKKLITNQKLSLFFRTPFHPFESFDDLKYKKLGSLPIAIAITALIYISVVMNVTACGFLYSNQLLRNYNSLFTLASSLGLLLLWSVCNWLVCSMFDGKGSFKEVYISTCYSLWPLILFLFIKAFLSNFISLEYYGVVTGIETVFVLYTFFLICIAMIKMHEYDFFKFITTGIVTVLLMILVVFIIFMCAILIDQFYSFIKNIYEEVLYR